jgi:queuine/archaeosine tRNA-ribosyltransferase
LTLRKARSLLNLFKCDLSSRIDRATLLHLFRSQNLNFPFLFGLNNIHHVNREPNHILRKGVAIQFHLVVEL